MPRFRFLLAAVLAALVSPLAASGQEVFSAQWELHKRQTPGEATHGGVAPDGRKARVVERQGIKDASQTFHIPVKKLPKGSVIEFDFNIKSPEKGGGHYAAAYFDGKKWQTLKTLSAYYKHPGTELITFRTEKVLKKELKLRLQTLPDDGAGAGKELLPPVLSRFGYTAARVRCCPAETALKDTVRLLIIGNSHTFYNFSASILKELAWSQGHYFDIETSTKGGQNFAQHCVLPKTLEKIRLGAFDAAIIQNNSRAMTEYGQDPEGKAKLKDDCVQLCDLIRTSSPGCRILLEQLWSYPHNDYLGCGSEEVMDRAIRTAATRMAEAGGCRISPIGEAAEILRREKAQLAIYQSDGYHPTRPLSYLKCCINYLEIMMMLGNEKPAFTEKVSNAGLEPGLAAQLRDLAVRTVLKHKNQ